MKDYSGKKCSGCGKYIWTGDEVSVCECGAPYHKECWEKIQTCSKCRSAAKAEKTVSANSSSDSSFMFSNIGSKIKGFATFVTVIGIIGGIITMILMCVSDEDMILPGILIGISIALASWIGSFVLYGFGALISYNQKSVALLSEIAEKLDK